MKANIAEPGELEKPSHEWVESGFQILIIDPCFVRRAEGTLSKSRKPIQKEVASYVCRKCGKR